MTESELLAILWKMKFPQRYYKLCKTLPGDPEIKKPKGSKKDILEVCKSLDAAIISDRHDRSYVLERDVIGDLAWEGLLAIHGGGYVELFFGGKTEEGRKWSVGSNFAVLSNLTMKTKHPDHEHEPPFPRPHYDNPEQLKKIVKEFILIIRDIKKALRDQATKS